MIKLEQIGIKYNNRRVLLKTQTPSGTLVLRIQLLLYFICHRGNCRRRGLMTEDEKKLFEDLPSPHSKYWVPCHWACTLTSIARNEGRIKDDISLKTLLQEINNFRAGLGSMYTFDWISIPLVYTQVTTLAIYTYFLATLLTSQFLDPSQGYPGHDVDLYVPAFSVLQFFFYMGWIKVAEQLTNPFGEGDDDFEVNWMIDRNLQVSLLAVDEMYMVLPKLEIDMYWDELEPIIPYTKSSVKTRIDPWLGSTADMSFSDCDMKVVMPMETIPENENYSMPSPHQHRYIHSNIELGTSINSGNLSSHKPRRISELVEGHVQRPLSLNSLSHSSPGTPVSERRTSHSPRKGHLSSSTRSPVPIRRPRGERTSKQESVASSYVERWLNGQRSRMNCSMSPSGNFTDITPPQSTVNSPTAVDAPKYTSISSNDATRVVHGFTVTMCDEQDEGRSSSANEPNVTNWGDTSGQPTNNAEGPSPSLAPIAESVTVPMHVGTDYGYTPYTNQSTVTSLTPLLETGESQESANKDEEPVV
ncbi:bestrophin-1 isoform X2 [Lingula anatina]|uniref:Bestrophin homolog n=1 Tax=Lingula anatina TaxID=7574 RepID=A0A1S3H6T0_LINAN|nr:bestrophin-1 isoform X2 [Lingula anatina]|eukprot:XP_013381687.1 bestrophin-1 isoform X2 [Lingula anatina]